MAMKIISKDRVIKTKQVRHPPYCPSPSDSNRGEARRWQCFFFPYCPAKRGCWRADCEDVGISAGREGARARRSWPPTRHRATAALLIERINIPGGAHLRREEHPLLHRQQLPGENDRLLPGQNQLVRTLWIAMHYRARSALPAEPCLASAAPALRPQQVPVAVHMPGTAAVPGAHYNPRHCQPGSRARWPHPHQTPGPTTPRCGRSDGREPEPHPNWHRPANHRYMALEFVNGGEMFTAIQGMQNRKFNWEQTRFFAAQTVRPMPSHSSVSSMSPPPGRGGAHIASRPCVCAQA